MKIQIKSIFGKILIDGDFTSLADALSVSKANLSWADLSGADLSWANLSGADLSGADLSGADLSKADLSGADLSWADLSKANLSKANLSGADLSWANLSGADLSGADLSKANLSGAKNSKLAIAQTRILPPEGEIVCWKKCASGVLVKLRIPSTAKRSHAFGRKCRASEVQVLEVIGAEIGISSWDTAVRYAVGETVKPSKPFDDDFTRECASGIHFFITREEAEAYNP